MRYLLPSLFAFIAMSNAQAMDTTTQGLVISSYVSSKVTSAPFDRKLILEARDDAAAFVASDGRIRGARLQAALSALHARRPRLSVDDLELAQAILVQPSHSTPCISGDAPCVNR
ncbi:DUF2388 domain-containing protein [Pseudomonas capeferrum]|uniref:DUF2388 domain-containing protein n=1 Tax=Pseudomonas capeferrum TaxID=1495066 RepID=UPI0015E40282|nr:DUF2388 domain-containing protein [Pseudomonas capeferrum]MBA1203953.1 DUF2388 domain-containing protein [Pseudomonas capeferrum]